MQLQLVSQRKKEYDEWRSQFREWVKRQREEQSLRKRQQLAQAMHEAHDRGYTIAEIMRAYGTTDRKTVTDIMALPLTGLEEVTPEEVYEFTVEAPGLYRVQDVLFRADDTPLGWYPYVEGPDAETELGVEMNNPKSRLHGAAKDWLGRVNAN